MNEPLPSASSTSEPIAYQPISGWAIAGLAISGLFALLVVASTIVGLYQGAPVFFPIWVLGLAAAGAIISYIGQRHIENSENTRTGIKLARAGIWLGIVSGLGYFSYFYVTGWALETQANSFLMDEGEDSGFFPRIRKGQLNAAFLLTLPAQARTGRPEDEKNMRDLHDVADPKDGSPGKLSTFRGSQFPRILHQHLGNDKTVITPREVLEWRYEKRSYAVLRKYEIATPELTAVFHVAVQSSEGDAAGQGRKWFVNMNNTYMIRETLKLTPVGEGVREARARARIWFVEWMQKLDQGASFTDVEKKPFKDVDKTAWDLLPVQALDRTKTRDWLYGSFARNDKARYHSLQILFRPDRPEFDLGKWEWHEGKVRVYYQIQFAAALQHTEPPALKVDAVAALETRAPLDLATFTERSPAPEWHLVSLAFTQISPLSQRGPQ